ncbi:hypothetical protein D043_2430A, partial [Vibrio parahaemolyticus EKP-021]
MADCKSRSCRSV